MTHLLEAALDLARHGCSVVPVATDGTKRPAGAWKQHQTTPADEATLTGWFSGTAYDGLGVITHARETNDMATQVPDSHGVYMVPAFVGLGAPHWDPDARASIHGLTLGAGAAHLARAALEALLRGAVRRPLAYSVTGNMAYAVAE